MAKAEQMVLGRTYILAYRLHHGSRNRFISANKSSNSNPYLGTFFTLRGLKSKISQDPAYYRKWEPEYTVYVYEMHTDGTVFLTDLKRLPEIYPEIWEGEPLGGTT